MPKPKPKKKTSQLNPGETITRIALALLDPSPTNRPNRSGFRPQVPSHRPPLADVCNPGGRRRLNFMSLITKDLHKTHNVHHQPPEPAAVEPRIGTGLNGWLRSAAWWG